MPDPEQPALDALYRAERSWMASASWCSCAAVVFIIGFSAYRSLAISLLVMGILCQALSWRAMRGAQRVEKTRLDRILRDG
jgi:hypothetical protein